MTRNSTPPKPYPIAFEVAGELGMFSDPASGGDGHSYPVPPVTACQGMIQAIDRCSGVEITVVAVGVCFTPQWNPYSYSTLVFERKAEQRRHNMPHLGRESILVKPTYQILAVLRNKPDWQQFRKLVNKTTSPAHMMQDHFFRRLRHGRSFWPVSLGRKEFLANYFGHFRTPINNQYNQQIPIITDHYFWGDNVVCGYMRDVVIKAGVVQYDRSFPTRVIDGNLAFFNQDIQNDLIKNSNKGRRAA